VQPFSRPVVVGVLLASLATAGLSGLPGSAAAASAAAAPSAAGSDAPPVPNGMPRPDPQAVSATDAASKWTLPTVTFPAPGSATVPVTATALSTAGAVGVADPAALGTLGLPTLPTGNEPQPDHLKAPAATRRWVPDAASAVPGSVQVTTLGDAVRQQLGGVPMVFTVARADGGAGNGPVAVSVDYHGFRDAYGGNYAERLELVRYPACVLTTPLLAGCSTGVPVANQVNDPYKTALTAVVDADGAAAAPQPAPAAVAQPALALPSPSDTSSPSATAAPTDSPSASASASPADATGSAAPTGSVFVVTSTPSGPSGTYIASPLVPSAHWSVGLSSGSLGYTYPVTVPAPPGGPAPDVTLDYDSGSVDGRTSVTNPQASWIGMGWDYQPGFIEREYASCNSLSGRSNADLCYTTSPTNVSLTLGGMTTHILLDADGTWRLQDDPGWSVVNATGANNDDKTGEYWKLQAPDGTIYYFGRGVGVAGGAPTKSTWTVPLFNYPNSLCATWCNKAWRWNLDYVVRANNNETTYTYTEETNAYNVNGVAVAQSYVRGGRLSTITYGLRDADTGTPVDKVVFTSVGRCVQEMNGATTACPTLGPANASSYPDVPTDLVCAANSTTCTQTSPSFWTTSMLRTIDTYVLNGAAYDQLDDYALQQQLPDPDGSGPEAPALWFSRVQHTGENGTPVSTPPTYLYGAAFANRFDIAAGVSPVDMYRVTQIENETGGYLDVSYGTPDPCTTALENGDHSQNTLDCFPVHWVPKGSSTWAAGWFIKYLISRTGEYVPYLGESPHTGAPWAVTSEPIVTDYDYIGGAAWHKNSFEVNPTLSDSWSVYRGYQTVRVLENQVSGSVIGPSYESVTVHQFYRGMYGDLNNDGTTKTNTVTTAEWGPANDDAWLAGREAEVVTETAGSTVVATTDTNYWVDQTAQMAMPGTNPIEYAKEVRPATTMVRTPNSDGTTLRHSIVDVHYNASTSRSLSNGAVVTHVDTGDLSKTDTEANCTNIVYVANTTRYLLEPEVSETDAGRASGSSCLGAVLAHQELFYDQTADSSTPPTQGNLMRSRVELSSTSYADSYATYDIYGRVTSATDANNHTTTTTYTPSTGRPSTVKVDSPALSRFGGLNLSATTTLDLRGMATQVSDANAQVTKQTFDALGRLTAAYAPTESGGTTPTFTAAYSVNDADWSSVHTRNLLTSGGVYRDTWTYLDGWQRTREVHTMPFGGGTSHLTTQTRYNDIGAVAASSSPYIAPGTINHGGDYTPPTNVLLEVDTSYDALHRVTSTARTSNGAQSWGRTTTSYAADRTITTPPSPAPVTTATIDAWGRPLVSTESSQIGGVPASATTYGYDPLGRLTSVTDAKGKTNTYGYDVGGRRTSTTDADAGRSTSTYDAGGNLLTTTDPLGDTVTMAYDEINRPVSVSADGHSNPVINGALVNYTYDSVAANGRGRPASVTVHDLGGTSGDWTSTVGGYDADGRVLSTTYTVPAVSGLSSALSYQTSTTYNPDGSAATVTDGALGDLPAETTTYGYETTGGVTGLPTTLTGPFNATASYTNLDQLSGRTYGDSTSAGYTTRAYGYETVLRRLSEITTTVTHNAVPVVQDDRYSYDNIDEPTQVGGNALGDSGQQTCFGYDGLSRLAKAWTETTSCGSWTATTADGPYGFNQQYGYDTNGVPTSVTNLGGTAVGYTPDTTHPHAIASFGGNAYTYDADGQQATRTVGGVATTLSWDPLHHLYQSVAAGATTKYVNAADGTRLARLDPDGSTTIWMAGNEVHVANGVVTATRYYSMAGATVAQRNASGLTWLASDGQNSRQVAVNASTGAATRTYYLPYGAVRTGAPALPTDQNFLGRVLDSSGLLQDGARYYDPSMGQFLSPDPLLVDASPYVYAGDNPTAFSDAAGLARSPGDDLPNSDGTPGNPLSQQPSVCTPLPPPPGPGLLDRAWHAGVDYLVEEANGAKDAAWGALGVEKVDANGGSHPVTLPDIPDPYPIDCDSFACNVARNLVRLAPAGALAVVAGPGALARDLPIDAEALAADEGVAAASDEAGSAAAGPAGGAAVRDSGGAVGAGRSLGPGAAHVGDPGFSPRYYRGARPGARPSFTLRRGEYKRSGAGQVRGLSVFDNPGAISSRGWVPFEIDQSTVPQELSFEQRGSDPAHFEIVPAGGGFVPLDDYQALLARIDVLEDW
jgi:RHS repeat-associated protein